LAGAIEFFRRKFRELACVAFTEAEPPCQHPGGYQVRALTDLQHLPSAMNPGCESWL
jgi:hypothetical protein